MTDWVQWHLGVASDQDGQHGFKTVEDVRIGKHITLEVEAKTEAEARQIAEEASKKLVDFALALGTFILIFNLKFIFKIRVEIECEGSMDNTTAIVVQLNWCLDYLTRSNSSCRVPDGVTLFSGSKYSTEQKGWL